MFPNPEILGIPLEWYSLWQWTAILTTICFGLWYYVYRLAEKIVLPKLGILILSFLVIGYLGARTFSILFEFTETGNWLELSVIWQNIGDGRLRWYGALLFLLLFLPLTAKLFRIKKLTPFLDAMALNLCLFNAIVKQACLFSGDGCYGIYTNSVFGMYFPYGYAPNILPVHPTPLYDSLFHFLFFVGLVWWNKRKFFNGQTAIAFFSGTAIFNIMLEFIRSNPELAMGLNLSQFTYILILLVTISYYLIIAKKQEKETIGITQIDI